MKITMLGTTGSGKTVYMSAMGELFFHSTLKGYRIGNRQYDREDVADDSFAYRGFEEIGSLYGDGTFPYGTTSSMIMPLELRYKGEHVIDIDWIDYRGQAIAELARHNIQSSNEEVHTTLLASDVIMVFVDAAILKATKNDMTARKRTGANAISELLMRVHKDKQFDIIYNLPNQ